MPEEERLSLVSEVEDEFTDDLAQLAADLDAVDDAISDTGRGRDHVRIDVEADVTDAVGELEAVDAAVDAVDDDVTIDVDVDDSDLLRDDVSVNTEGRGSQFIDESTGQFTSPDDAVDHRFGDLGDSIEDDLSITSDVDVDAKLDTVEDRLFQGGPNLTDEEATEVADMFNPKSAFRQTPELDDADSTAVTGGGADRESFSIENIDDWADSVEPFLDRETLGRRGGEVTNVDEIIDRDFDDVVDFDRAVDLAVDPDSNIDVDTLQGVTHGGPGDFTDAVEELDDADATLLGGNSFRKQIRRFRQDMGDLHPTMRGFHNAVAAMIPLLGVFAGAIPAAVVGLGALATAAVGVAGALGGIGALGLMGMSLQETGEVSMQPIRDRLSAVAGEYVDAFAPLAHSFAPVVDSAITSIEMMAGPLADASQGLLAFRDEFRGLVDFTTSAIPSFTRDALAFTAAATPLLAGLTGFLADVDVFGYLAGQLSQALPSLMMIGSALTDILPLVVQVSQGFLMAAGAVTGAVRAVAGFLNQFPMLMTALGAVTGGLLAVVSASALWSIATTGLIGSIGSLAKTIFVSVLPALNAKIAGLLGVAQASWTAYAATGALLGLLSFGLVPVISSLGSMFGGMQGNIAGARKELERFANSDTAYSTGMPAGSGGSGRTPTGQASNPYIDKSTTIIEAGNQDDAARQQYSSSHEKRQHVDAVFGSG